MKYLRKIYNFLFKTILFWVNPEVLKLVSRKQEIIRNTNPSPEFLKEKIPNSKIRKKIHSKFEKKKYVKIGYMDEQGQVVLRKKYKYDNSEINYKNYVHNKVKKSIQIVISENDVVGIKKKHDSTKSLIRELYAMYKFQKINIKTPKIIGYSLRKKYIIMEFLEGVNMRRALYDMGAEQKIQELLISTAYEEKSSLEQYYLRLEVEKDFLKKILTKEQVDKLFEEFKAILDEGLIYQDIKYPNFVIKKDEIYWIDFEHCNAHPLAPEFLFELISEQYKKKFQEHFNVYSVPDTVN